MITTTLQRHLHSIVLTALVAISLLAPATRGDNADIESQLTAKGAKFTKTKGVTASVQIADCSAWTQDDFKSLSKLSALQNLDFGGGLTDQGVAQLGSLADVIVIQTNKAQVTDDGVKYFLQFKKLRMLKFFHPNKSFTGVGLAQLADLASLQSLTVAGSEAFGDEGIGAVAKLSQLQEFRCWHSGNTLTGVSKLKALPGLKSINLGQRLAYKPPTAVSDETITVLAEMKSLESIQLSEARLKLIALAELKQLPQLKTLTLDGIDMPEADVEQLKKELPKAQIKWTKPSEAYAKRIKALFGAG